MKNKVNIHQIIFCLSAAIMSLIISCDDCDRSGCEYTSAPVKNAEIESGIAGGASYSTDLVENGCKECLFENGSINIWSSSQSVTTLDLARSLFESGEPPVSEIDFSETYEKALEAGEYMACISESEEVICAGITIPQSGVVTLHIRFTYGPPSIVVFPAGSDKPDDKNIFRWFKSKSK